MTNLAHALAGGAASLACACGTKSLGLAAGYAWAVPLPNTFSIASLTGASRRQDARLGSMSGDGVAASRVTAGVAGWMAGDLSPAGLESARQPHGESRRNRGTN